MMLPAGWLAAPLADHLVLARPGPQRGQKLLVLDPLAGWIWRSHRAGLSIIEIAELLAARFSLPLPQAHTDIVALLEAWQREGEGGIAVTAPAASPIRVENAGLPDPPPTAQTRLLQLADRRVALLVDDPALAEPLARITRHLDAEPTALADQNLRLGGTTSGWWLAVDETLIATGDTADEAIARTVFELVELGCNTARRLLVLHAAGVSRAGRGVVLIGQGGAGKTTLAAALNAEGFDLLGDDVIPVNPDGQLVGIGMSLCLKAGSWPVLASRLLDLDRAPRIARAGQAVCFPPPPGPIARGPMPAGVLLFPRYQPGGKPTLEPLEPVAALQGIIAAGSVIAHLTQDALTALIRWISAIPAFSLTYPDLDHALALIAQRLPIESPRRGAPPLLGQAGEFSQPV